MSHSSDSPRVNERSLRLVIVMNHSHGVVIAKSVMTYIVRDDSRVMTYIVRDDSLRRSSDCNESL